MKRESLVFALSGTFFGLIVGWIIGSQQGAVRAPDPAAAPAAASAPANGGAPFDASRAAQLEQQAAADPRNASVRIALANLYFDAQRFDQAATWYEAALAIDPTDVNASTDLAVAYYQLQQPDKALAQIDHSLEVDPRHLKTLLNQGIIRAFGKQDLAGAAQSWQRVVDIAPDSEEGRRARQGLDGIAAAQKGSGSTSGATGAGGGAAGE